MATKLKNLKIRKVDFVDEGANPDAHIRMLKRKDGEMQIAEENRRKGSGSILKKMLGFIGKAAGMNQEEIDSVVDEIQKGDSVSFNEKINEVKNYKIADEMWNTCYALQSSLCSILNDEEMDSTGAETAMQESLDEFYAVVQESIKEWSSGKSASIVRKSEEVSEADVEVAKLAVEKLSAIIEKAKSKKNQKGTNSMKGDEEEMRVDKSKMTPAERAFYEDLEKRYGTEDGVQVETPAQGTQSVDPTITKFLTPPTQAETTQPHTTESEGTDIYKGLHPAVRAELEALSKFKADAEERELTEVAKKYEIIGKKPEELVPLFKSLKAAGGTAYKDMIAVLDQTVDTVEKSGVFSEVGKVGHSNGENTAETKIGVIAKSLMEKDATLSYSQAVAKAWEDNPDLLAEYDEQEGF